MKKFFGITVVFLLLSAVCWAGGNKDKAAQPSTQPQPQQQAAPQQPAQPASPFFTGNGGKGMSIAILAPKSTGLAKDQDYLPSLVQGEFVSNFSGYSAISVLDRQRLDEQYTELLSGYYDDNAQAGLDLGHLTPTDYIMGGNITKTTTGYALQMQITKSADKMTTASYSGTCTFTELDNLTGIRRASLDLLEKMGVTSTERAKTELAGAAVANHVNAQTALAQGITAQKGGTVVEALSHYIQSNNYDPGLAEAASRLNILSANVSSGNIGANVRNDLQWRDQWVARLKECEEYYIKQMANPPYYLAYSTNIKQGAIDYQKRTVPLSINMGLYPDPFWFDTVQRVVDTVRQGLEATGRAKTWGLNWPSTGITSPYFFADNFNAYWVSVEILNNEGKSIARQTDGMVYGWEWRAKPLRFSDNRKTFARLKPAESKRELVFPAVDPNAITDNLSIRISAIDGVPADRAAGQKNISIVTDSEYLRTPVPAALVKKRQPKNIVTGGTQGSYLAEQDIASFSFEYEKGEWSGGSSLAGSGREERNFSVDWSYIIRLVDYGKTELTGEIKVNTNWFEKRMWVIVPPTVTSINNLEFSWGAQIIESLVFPPSVKRIALRSNGYLDPIIVVIGANVEFERRGILSPYYNENGKKAGRYTYDPDSETWEWSSPL
jgi:hypothetical protein